MKWNTVPNRYKNLNSLDEFKQQIKITCTCKLCKLCMLDTYFKIYDDFIFLIKVIFVSYFTVTIC